MKTPFFFNKPFRLSDAEKALFLDCADKATASLKRNQKKDSFLWPGSGMRLLGGLATYAFLLRHIAAGRRVRYFAPFHAAGCMAAFLGHAEVLHVFEAHGVPLETLSWSWRKPNVLDFAVMGRHHKLVKDLLVRHPALLTKDGEQDAVAYCVQYGTLPILRLLVRSGASLRTKYWHESTWNRQRVQDGTPFFLAVANDRRDMVRELIRLDAFSDPNHTGGMSAVHLDASLLSIAIQHCDFELADWLVDKGCTHEEMFDLPNDSFAWKNLKSFRYLCQKFPAEDFKSDVREGGEWILQSVSKEVLSYAWDGRVPERVLAEWKKFQNEERGWRPGNPFPEDNCKLAIALNNHPDEILRLEKMQPGRLRKLLLGRDWYRFSSLVYMLRLARAHGIVLFPKEADKDLFLKVIHYNELENLRPHLKEFGFPAVSNAEMARRRIMERGRRPKRDRRQERLRNLAATPWTNLGSVLDNPTLDPNLEVTPNWPFALEVALRATPRMFDAWVLRGMNPYARNCEGVTAVEVGNAGLLSHLVHAYGMSPDHVCYDGSTPVGNAIHTNDAKRLRLLIKEGADVSGDGRRFTSVLYTAIRDGHDEISRFLIRHGAVNRDMSGRVRPVEPWMVGLKNRLPGKDVSATLRTRGTPRRRRDAPRIVTPVEVSPPSRTKNRGSRSR